MIFLFEDRKSDACTRIVSCLVDGKHGRGVLNKEVDFSSFLYLVTLVLNLVVWFVSSDLSDEWAQRWAGDFELNPDLHLPAENKFIGQYRSNTSCDRWIKSIDTNYKTRLPHCRLFVRLMMTFFFFVLQRRTSPWRRPTVRTLSFPSGSWTRIEDVCGTRRTTSSRSPKVSRVVASAWNNNERCHHQFLCWLGGCDRF